MTPTIGASEDPSLKPRLFVITHLLKKIVLPDSEIFVQLTEAINYRRQSEPALYCLSCRQCFILPMA